MFLTSPLAGAVSNTFDAPLGTTCLDSASRSLNTPVLSTINAFEVDGIASDGTCLAEDIRSTVTMIRRNVARLASEVTL